MTIADITLFPVPSGRKSAYVAFSKRMAEVYRDHGAVSVVDYWQSDRPSDPTEFHAADVSYEAGQLRSIAGLSGALATESVVVSVMIWPSREVRDRGVLAATQDPRVLATLDEDAIFEGARVAGDTFEIVLSDPCDD